MGSVPEDGCDKRDWKPQPAIMVHSPATLPMCDQLESRMVLNGPTHCSLNARRSQSPNNNRYGATSKPGPLFLPPLNVSGGGGLKGGTSGPQSLTQTLPCHPPPPSHPPVFPHLKTGLHKPMIPKPPPPAVKPLLPATKSKQGPALQ